MLSDKIKYMREQGYVTDIDYKLIDNGISLLDLMMTITQQELETSRKNLDGHFCNSKSDVRRMVKQGAVKINDRKILDPDLLIDSNYVKNGWIRLSIGKKHPRFVATTFPADGSYTINLSSTPEALRRNYTEYNR